MTKFVVLAFTLFTFSMSIAQDAYKDCSTAEQVLEANNYRYGDIPGTGDKYEKIGYFQDGNEISETNSVWLSWEIAEAGDLYFDIVPINDNDDIDFVLYRATSNCDDKEEIRSILSGVNVITKLSSEPCFGATGLSPNSIDLTESSGCAAGDDNYAKSVQTRKGDIYYLLINNYYDKTGFKLRFHGSAVFVKPQDAQVYGKLRLETLSVYPNPAADFVQIDLAIEDLNTTKVYITDMQGRIVQRINQLSDQTTVDVTHLLSGTYTVVADNGKDHREVQQFVKQ